MFYYVAANNSNLQYHIIKLDIVDNIGESDGSELIQWISSFYIADRNSYAYNINNEKAKDFCIISTGENFIPINKFAITGCVVKSAIFHKNFGEDLMPQISLEITFKSIINSGPLVIGAF